MQRAHRETQITPPPELDKLTEGFCRAFVISPQAVQYQTTFDLLQLVPKGDQDIRVRHYDQGADPDAVSEHDRAALPPEADSATVARLDIRPS